MQVTYCSRCLMPSSRPRIVFTGSVCNACLWAEERKTIDYAERREMFRELVAKHKKHPAYDMVLPFSGGKDSAAIAYKLKEMGFNPLLVTYGQLMWTDVGMHNWHAVRNAGFDIEYHGVNQDVSRSLARRFFIERGHPKQHYDAGVNSVPVRSAVDRGIPLVIYAEHGESEYGGLVLSDDHRRRRDLDEVLENQVGDDPRNWATGGITDADMWPYLYPDNVDGIEAVYFSWYFPWSIYDNAMFCREKMGFQQAHSSFYSGAAFNGGDDRLDADLETMCGRPLWWGKSDGSFEGFDSIDDEIDDSDFFMMHIKFGFGRATRMASRLIQRGHMTREEGLKLARRYDGEYPRTYLPSVLEYMHMTRDEFAEVVEAHRNPEIWKQENGKWVLRNPPK